MSNNYDLEIFVKINSILNQYHVEIDDLNYIGRLIIELSTDENSLRNSHGVLNLSTGRKNKPTIDCAMVDFDYFAQWVEIDEIPTNINLLICDLDNKVNFILASHEIKKLKIDDVAFKHIFDFKYSILRVYTEIEDDLSALSELKEEIVSKIENFLLETKSGIKELYRNDQSMRNILKHKVNKLKTTDAARDVIILASEIDLLINGFILDCVATKLILPQEFLGLLKIKVAIEEYEFHQLTEEKALRSLNKLALYCDELFKNDNPAVITPNDDIYEDLKSVSKLTEIIEDIDYKKCFIVACSFIRQQFKNLRSDLNKLINFRESRKLDSTDSVIIRYLFELSSSKSIEHTSFFIQQIVGDYELLIQKQKYQSEADEKLIKLMIDSIIGRSRDVLTTCILIGESMYKITWNETNENCVRNKHGVYNKCKRAKTKENSTGTKINFETLAHMKDLTLDIVISKRFQQFITHHPTLYKQEFEILQMKLKATLKEKEEKPTGTLKLELLENTASYLHDLVILPKINALLVDYLSTISNTLFDFNNFICRYHIAYLFVQIGELSKQVSNQLNGNFVLKHLFKLLYGFRKDIKGRPTSVSNFQKDTFFTQINEKFKRFSGKLIELLDRLMAWLKKDIDFDKVKRYNAINQQEDKYSLSSFEKLYFVELIQIITICLINPLPNVNEVTTQIIYNKKALDKLFNTSVDLNTLHETGLSKLPLHFIKSDLLKQLEGNISKGTSTRLGKFKYDHKKVEILTRLVCYIFLSLDATDLIKVQTIGDLNEIMNGNERIKNRQEIAEEHQKKKLVKIVRMLCHFNENLLQKEFTVGNICLARDDYFQGNKTEERKKQIFKKDDMSDSHLGFSFFTACKQLWNQTDETQIINYICSNKIKIKDFLSQVKSKQPVNTTSSPKYVQIYLKKNMFLLGQLNMLKTIQAEKGIFTENAHKMSIGITGQAIKDLFSDFNLKIYTIDLLSMDEEFFEASKKTVGERHSIMHLKSEFTTTETDKIEHWDQQNISLFASLNLNEEIKINLEKSLLLVLKIVKFKVHCQFDELVEYFQNNKILQTFVNNDKIFGKNMEKSAICGSYLEAIDQINEREEVRNEKLKNFILSCMKYLKIMGINDQEINETVQVVLLSISMKGININMSETVLNNSSLWSKFALLFKYNQEKDFEKFVQINNEIISDTEGTDNIDELYMAYYFRIYYYFKIESPAEMCYFLNKAYELRKCKGENSFN